ncbi:MAG: 30S ribosomal protein S2 [Planctomycetes bacterium]|nr:30S ribosomal protein S2 [Planctomycetota bacterium]HON44999.1 30S ribosomal protein S2 [Planctomycetota bacterium]HRU52594.1 30S ribosomal protein S2 [Planctomycetota bacterium]
MAIISVKSLLEAGVHFGHRVSRWNPKMAPYIFGRRNNIHIIDLRETVKGLIRAYYFLKSVSAEGYEVLFVGTKRQAKSVIQREALRCEMHYVSERWLGGTLTNFATIHERLQRLEYLEAIEEDGRIQDLSKKMASMLRREKKKTLRNLEGIRNMGKLPGVLVVIDPLKEHIAIKEAIKLNIPTICLMDTDSNPDLVDIPIPGNDDAMRSIEVICTKLADAIAAGKKVWKEKQEIAEKHRREYSVQREQGTAPDGAIKERFHRDGDKRNEDDRRRRSKRRGNKRFTRDNDRKQEGETPVQTTVEATPAPVVTPEKAEAAE